MKKSLMVVLINYKRSVIKVKKVFLFKILFLSFFCFLFIINISSAQNQKKSADLIGEAKDKNTVALWLFDESAYPNAILTDASLYEIADLSLTCGTLVPGKFGNALSDVSGYNVIYSGFAGNGALQPRGPDGVPSGLWGPTYASQPLNDALGKKEYTIEFWLNLKEAPISDAFIFDMGRGFQKGFSVLMNANGNGIKIDNYYAGVSSVFDLTGIVLEKDTFTHFLLTVDKYGKGNIYLNGKRKAEATTTQIEKVPLPDIESPRSDFQNNRGWSSGSLATWQQNRFNLSILEDRKYSNYLSASIDEIRISDTIRTTSDFIPATYSRNYSSDPYELSGITGLPQLLSVNERINYHAKNNPLKFGIRKHLFIDTKIIESGKINNLKLTPNNLSFATAEKTNINKLDGEWRISFVQDGERMLGIATANYNSNKGLVYLYETTDGLNFTAKPVNMVNYPMGGDLFLDNSPNAIAEGTKFKLTAYVSNRGIYLYTSPDAINWRRNETAMLPLLSGGSAESFYDDQTGSFVTYLKRDASFGNAETPKLNIRTSVRFNTPDPYRAWPFKKMNTPYFEDGPFPAVTGEGKTQFIGSAEAQVYRTRAIKYPYAPDTYLGFPWIYHQSANDRDISMAVSRDGDDWTVFWNPYYTDKGGFSEAISCQGLLRKGNELWQYIEFGADHGSGMRQWYRFKIRLDGFCSLDAADNEGSAITKSLKIDGNNLFVNYKTGENGYLKIQILDSTGNVIPGFESKDCITMTGDKISDKVLWSNAKFSELKGRSIKIQFILKNTKLFSFETSNLDNPITEINQIEKNNSKSITLIQNYPNPFTDTTKIEFEVNKPLPIKTQLKVFDLHGKEVRTLVDSFLETGNYHVDFDAHELPQGIYLIRLDHGNDSVCKKLTKLN